MSDKRTITVRPSAIIKKPDYWSTRFLDSLGIDPQKRNEERKVTLKYHQQIDILGIILEASQIVSNDWEWKINEDEYGNYFILNNEVIAVNGKKSAISSGSLIHDFITRIPKSVKYLNLSNCYSIEIIDGIEKLTGIEVIDLSMNRSLYDLSPVSELIYLKQLYLKSINSLDGEKLPKNLDKIELIDLSFCQYLNKIDSVSRYKSLRNINLSNCDVLEDISPLECLQNLTALDISSCETLFNIEPIATLNNLEYLNLSFNKHIQDLNPIKDLYNLKNLEIDVCYSLSNLNPIKNLKSLRALSLAANSSIKDISAIGHLNGIVHLNLSGLMVDKIEDLQYLERLEFLNLSGCRYIKNIAPLSKLNKIKDINLSSCNSLSDITHLATLREIESLDLSSCHSINDISPLFGMDKLKKLKLYNCDKINDISVLYTLKVLNELDLSMCSNIEDLKPLEGLHELKTLHLKAQELKISGQPEIVDISSLGKISNLESLDLSSQEAVTDLTVLGNLKRLVSLDLSYCTSVKDFSPLGGIESLQELSISGLNRITSLEMLRSLPDLRSISTAFHPGIVAEILCHSACFRRDADYIERSASDWLIELQSFTPEMLSQQELLASTLGRSFCMIDDSELGDRFEQILDLHPEFTSAPWKAWFGGSYKESGFVLYRKRVERVPITKMTAGAIGGACATLPESEPAWSRQWLTELEKERSANARELLPVAPEICLAYARLGEMEALGRWQERLTDPSDPGALDELQVSLAKWRLSSGDLQKARSHISAIHSPSARDPILSELVMAELATDPDTASEDLLMIQGSQTRSNLAKKLAAEPAFTKSESRLHRLLVAAGENPAALAELITLLGASVPSEIVNRLSAHLGLPQTELQQWRIAQLETLLKQLQTIAKI